MVHSSGSSAEWPLGDPSVEGSFVVDHADSLNGSSLSLSAKVASLHPENSDGNRSRAPTRREEEQEDEELESSQDMVPKLIGLSGEAWPHGVQPRVTDPAERLRNIVCHLIEKSEQARIMFMWRLNATRSKASALAVWAVDQGNRKAYEVERALMAENSWATRSVIWEGYRHSPLVSVSDSGWFWAERDAYGEGKTAGALGAELRLAQQRGRLLAAQLEAARQQLTEWQEVAEFASVDGRWCSLRVRDLERQLRAARLTHRLRHHLLHPEPLSPSANPPPAPHSAPVSPAASDPEPEPEPLEPAHARRMNLRSWMMGYESEREIRSNIPGLATTPREKPLKPGRGRGAGGGEGMSGEFGDDRMRELLAEEALAEEHGGGAGGGGGGGGAPAGALRPPAPAPARDKEGAGSGGKRGPGETEREYRERVRREAVERKYEELRGVAVHLEETLVDTAQWLQAKTLEEQRLRTLLADHSRHRPSHPAPRDPAPLHPLPPAPAPSTGVAVLGAEGGEEGAGGRGGGGVGAGGVGVRALPLTHRHQAVQAGEAQAEGGAEGEGEGEGSAVLWCPEAAPAPPHPHPHPPPPSPDSPLRPLHPPLDHPLPTPSPAAGEGGDGAGAGGGREVVGLGREVSEVKEELRRELEEVKEQLRQRTAQLKEAVAIGVGIEWVM